MGNSYISYFPRHILKKIIKEYEKNDIPWILAYSGGKDSTALLKIVLEAITISKNKNRKLYIVYCDTGVEFPLISSYVKINMVYSYQPILLLHFAHLRKSS